MALYNTPIIDQTAFFHLPSADNFRCVILLQLPHQLTQQIVCTSAAQNNLLHQLVIRSRANIAQHTHRYTWYSGPAMPIKLIRHTVIMLYNELQHYTKYIHKLRLLVSPTIACGPSCNFHYHGRADNFSLGGRTFFHHARWYHKNIIFDMYI